VTFARELYKRFRQLIHEFAKFGVIGVIGLFITNAVYDALYNHLAMGPVKSATIATVVAAVATYLGNRYWSFRHRARPGVMRETAVFVVLNGIGLLIQDAAVAFNYYVLGLGHNKIAGFIALNFGIAVATLFRFWSYRRFVWLAPAPPAGGAGDAAGRPTPAGYPPAERLPADGGAITSGTVTGAATPFVTGTNGHRRPASHRANGHPLHDEISPARSPFQR
jgi:putative flippase GtrA